MKDLNDKLKSWASVIEPDALRQAKETASMPFIHPWVALMPDVHYGKGCSVGTVLPTLGAIIPAAVGVDIGCGMIAVRTQFHGSDLPADRRPLRLAIEAAVPLSAGRYNSRVEHQHTQARIDELETQARGFNPDGYAANWRLQLGTLGSGNHFIEVSLDEGDRVWLFLHSGSRGVGNKIATHFIKVAQEQCKKRWIALPNPDLAYLVEGDREFWDYMAGLRWAQHFALLNREEMMDRVVACFEEWIGHEVERTFEVNCHHNYTVKERHFGKEVWLSRKGAIDASEGMWGLIPGSMGTRSYVVQGLGNRLSLNSSPHGAGREYGRNAAKRAFTYEQLAASMEGIEWSGSKEFLDEIPSAYKAVEQVMADAADLVVPRFVLRQIVNVKGD